MKVLTMIVNTYLEKNLCCKLWFSSAGAHISKYYYEKGLLISLQCHSFSLVDEDSPYMQILLK